MVNYLEEYVIGYGLDIPLFVHKGGIIINPKLVQTEDIVIFKDIHKVNKTILTNIKIGVEHMLDLLSIFGKLSSTGSCVVFTNNLGEEFALSADKSMTYLHKSSELLIQLPNKIFMDFKEDRFNIYQTYFQKTMKKIS